MSVDTDIEKALNIKMSEAVAFPIDYQNNSSTQTDSFYSVEILPAETDSLATLSFAGYSDYLGIFQVNFYNKKDSGRVNYYTGLDEIRALFAVGTTLTQNGTSVLIESSYPDATIEIGEWSVTPININYRVLR